MSAEVGGTGAVAKVGLAIPVARCPGCHLERDVDAQVALRATEAIWVAWEAARTHDVWERGGTEMRLLAAEGHPRWFWACDECVDAGRAVVADVTRVTVSMGIPFAAYVDRPFRCEDCGADAVFSAREQQHWFETLGFLIWVYPKQCAPCRANRRVRARANTALADALQNLDLEDPSQLDAIAKLYDELGSADKAAEFRARANNRRTR